MQLHDVLAGVPLVEELQQVDGALADRGDGQLARIGPAAGADGDVLGAVGAGQNRQEHIVLGVVAHQLINVPPGGHTHPALLALGHQLGIRLGEHLHIHQALGVPVVEVGHGFPVLVVHAHKLDGAVALENQIVADIIGPVGPA